jgi:hypothetical protein
LDSNYLRQPPHDGLLVIIARDWQLITFSVNFHHLVISHARHTVKKQVVSHLLIL